MNEQTENLTGYPSIDKPWLKYYKQGDSGEAIEIPQNKIVWDVIEEKLSEYPDIPALEYFGRKISRKEFTESIYVWARAFKAMGVEAEEVVPIYGPFFPDICAMAFALNIIGATAYFLKLAITPEALAEETKQSKIAVVYEDMWANVKSEFCKERFEIVIFTAAADAMPSPKKQVVNFMDFVLRKKSKLEIPEGKKYLGVREAKEKASSYTGNIRAKFVSNRSAYITSSSGTTVGGVVKGTVATNESTLAQIIMAANIDIQYYAGDRCLNNLPPTASTSLNVLFFMALYHGLTVVVDPRVSEKDFYNQIVKLKPNIVVTTGSMWESFFNRVSEKMEKGKTFDFSCARRWIIGGEGTDPHKFAQWDKIIHTAKAESDLISAYGSSELFSGISVDKYDAKSNLNNVRSVMGVGIPYLGITAGVFDASGRELPYNTRGELWVKSRSAMKEYYNKPELTAQTVVDGWVHTGDLAEIDEDGFLYIWGRIKDKATLENGREVYLFDIANEIRKHPAIDDTAVNEETLPGGQKILVAYIVWNKEIKEEEKEACLDEMDRQIETNLPGVVIGGYLEHENTLPYSKTTLKKDRKGMIKNISGYRRVRSRELEEYVRTVN